jgi:hypothetical protein
MSNKKVLLLILTVIAAFALTVPFTGRTANLGPSLKRNATTPESSRIEGATSPATEDVPQVVSVQATPSGFEPRETIAPSGKFLILLQNRTGRRDLNFYLARENQGRVAQSEPHRRDWKVQLQLAPGTYIIGETNHPEWKSIIRVTN